MAVAAIIAAAGASSRAGVGPSKVLRPIGGVTALDRVIATLRQIPDISRIVVACRPEDRASVRGVEIVDGGASRHQSVKNALASLSSQPPEFVLIHDAARALVTQELIEHVLAAAYEFGAVTAAIPAVDTLVSAKSGTVGDYLDRSSIQQIQTPQAFCWDLIKRGHEAYCPEAPDDAILVSSFQPVRLVLGSRLNFKLTTSEDFELAEALVEKSFR